VTEPVAVRKRRGCLFFGCLGGTVCLVIILVAFLLGLYQLKKMLTFYTDPQPMALPTVKMSQADIDTLKQRVESFQDAVRTGRPTEPLTVTSDEINAYIQNDPNLAGVKGKVYVTIEGDRVKSQVSLPLDDLGFRVFHGRYLNGVGIFALNLQRGNLVVTAESLVVKGKPLPAVYMDKFKSQNLADAFNKNPRVSVALSHLQEIRVADGKLTLVPKLEQ